MNWKQISVVVFWLAYVSAIGPALISHASYELPLVGVALAVVGGWATFRVFNKRTSA